MHIEAFHLLDEFLKITARIFNAGMEAEIDDGVFC
jgi:hypothetical protein